MSIPVILDTLIREKKIYLTLTEGRLDYAAHRGVVTPSIKDLLKRNKEELIERLRPTGPQSPIINPTATGACRLMKGDCRDILKGIPTSSVDCIVTDPPYGLAFMSKAWDKAIPPVEVWKECYRVLKPGAFAFILCSPRLDLLCRMISHLETAGFATGFSPIYWTYATGKDKATKVARIIGKTVGQDKAAPLLGACGGFQPKPAVEVILVVMKPRDQQSYTAQALSNGKGVTWMDDCKIPRVAPEEGEPRFPANLLVSGNVLDGQKSPDIGHSRFFSLDAWAENTLPFLVIPKASKAEKEAGLKGREKIQVKGLDFGQDIRNNPYKIRPVKRANIHPTVKPLELMAYLIVMGSREGDVILDPFCGSGTTNMAALLLNRKSIGIEKAPEYYQIAQARVKHALKHVIIAEARAQKDTDEDLPPKEGQDASVAA